MHPESSYHKYLLLIGEKIADARHLLGKNEHIVAKAVGLSQGTLSKIESGMYYSLRVTTIIDLSKYLKIPLAELLPPPQYSIIKYPFVNKIFLLGI